MREVMSKVIRTLACLLCIAVPALAAGDASRWITFKTGQVSEGRVEYQIDRSTIQREGPYSTFWTRIWLVRLGQPRVFSLHERLFFWSRKFAVDCAHHSYGPRFIDSTNWAEKKRSAALQTMHWESLDKVPVIGRVVCGK